MSKTNFDDLDLAVPGIEADEINCYGGKPLQWASEHQPEVVQLLLERGAELEDLQSVLPRSPEGRIDHSASSSRTRRFTSLPSNRPRTIGMIFPMTGPICVAPPAMISRIMARTSSSPRGGGR